MGDNENKNKHIIIFGVFVIAFILVILAIITPLGTYLYNEDVRYMRNAEDYLNTFYPVNEDNLQGAIVMLGANNLNYGSRLSLRLENLNNAFIDLSNELQLALEYKGIVDSLQYNIDEYYNMFIYINRSNSLMEFVIGILENL